MRVSSSIYNPVQAAALTLSRSAVMETPSIAVQQQVELESPAVPVQKQADLESPSKPVAAKTVSLQSTIQPVLAQMVADFGSLTDTQRRNPGISTVSRVDMAELVGHSTSKTLLYLTSYDPETYTGKDGNLFVDLETSLQSGEQKVTRRFEADIPLSEEDFNNLADKMPNRYLDTERFAIQLDRFKEFRVRSQQLDISRFQEMLEEMMKKTATEKTEDLKEKIEKAQEKMEYSSTKVDEQPVDENVPAVQTELSEADKAMLRELEARDMAVRAHEMAHMAAGAGLTGGATFTYQVGPDGKQYAIGGEVSINISSGSTPEDTVNRAQRILSAATAPSDPSSADRAVAMQASQMLAMAQIEIARERQAETEENTPVSEKREAEKLPEVFSSAQDDRDGSDSITGTIEGQAQLTQEQAAQTSATFRTTSSGKVLDASNNNEENEENSALATSLSNSPYRGLEFNENEVLPVIPSETAQNRDRFTPNTPILDEESKLPTFNTQNGQFIPTEPTTLDTDNLPDVKIQDATLFDVDVTTIEGRHESTQLPPQESLTGDLNPDASTNRFTPEAQVRIPTKELIASEEQIDRNLTRGQEGNPTLEDLLNAPVLLNNPRNEALEPKEAVVANIENIENIADLIQVSETAKESPTISSAATQAGPIAIASNLQSIQRPDSSSLHENISPQERTTQEANSSSPFSLSGIETQTRFAVTQTSFLSLLDE